MQTILTTRPIAFKGLKSAFILSQNETGGMTKTLIYQEPRRKPRVSKRWRGIEKAVHRLTKVQEIMLRDYLERHERSNMRKQDGWIKELAPNVRKSLRRGLKEIL